MQTQIELRKIVGPKEEVWPPNIINSQMVPVKCL